MSILNEDFVMVGIDYESVIFRKPFLNDKKELIFLFCNKFNPSLQFSFNEKLEAMQFCENGVVAASVFLRNRNEKFLHKAIEAKKYILNELRLYTQSLKSGKEQIFIFDSIDKECPYYFVSDSQNQFGHYSVKFEVGFLYFFNRFSDTNFNWEEMQRHLVTKFKKVEKRKFQVNEKGESYYKITFKELCEIV